MNILVFKIIFKIDAIQFEKIKPKIKIIILIFGSKSNKSLIKFKEGFGFPIKKFSNLVRKRITINSEQPVIKAIGKR